MRPFVNNIRGVELLLLVLVLLVLVLLVLVLVLVVLVLLLLLLVLLLLLNKQLESGREETPAVGIRSGLTLDRPTCGTK